MNTEQSKVQAAAAYIREAAAQRQIPLPQVAVVLGSGLGALTEQLETAVQLPYTDIPHFPVPTVASHAGVLHIGSLRGTPVFLFSGRYHYYEGYDFRTVTFYVRVLHELGVKVLALTNAAGGINTEFAVGDFMLITDHIKLCADSPERGAGDGWFGPRFFDMTTAYTPRLCAVAHQSAAAVPVSLREGVYCFMGGPQFETPAEIRALRLLGGDAVGMSTVPEAITASRCGMEVLGLSCITNAAAGVVEGAPVSDEEVTETANRVAREFCALVSEIVHRLGKDT